MMEKVLGQKNSTCKCCGKDTEDLEEHLREDHKISGWTYWTINTLRGDLNRACPDCGTPRYLLSPCIPGTYIPCQKCCSPRESTEYLFGKIRDLQESIRNSKAKQGLWASERIIQNTLSYDVDEALKVITPSGRISKDSYLGVYIKPGYPLEISQRNIKGIEKILLQVPVTKDLRFQIQDRSYQILLPETCGYDVRHHARYSILSVGSGKATRYTKRIRLEGNDCYKFWNNPGFPDIKSIFRVIPETTEEILPGDLGFIKQIILRNRVTSEILWRIYMEILKYTKDLEDWVLLYNNLPGIFPGGKVKTKITWVPGKEKLGEGINISIL